MIAAFEKKYEFMSMNKIGHYVIMSVYFFPVVYSQKEKSV